MGDTRSRTAGGDAPSDRHPAEQPPGLMARLGWRLFWFAAAIPVRILFRIRVENAPTLDGAYVIVANHASFLDPFLLGAGRYRRMTFLMTVLHFRSARLGWFYRWQRTIPLVVRGLGNRAALRAAKAVLDRGDVLTIFPEGAVTRDGGMSLGNPGAVSIALSGNVPIVPCFLEGAREALPNGGGLRLRPVTLRFGAPIGHDELFAGVTDRRARLQRATRVLMDRIAELGGVVSRETELEGESTAAVSRA